MVTAGSNAQYNPLPCQKHFYISHIDNGTAMITQRFGHIYPKSRQVLAFPSLASKSPRLPTGITTCITKGDRYINSGRKPNSNHQQRLTQPPSPHCDGSPQPEDRSIRLRLPVPLTYFSPRHTRSGLRFGPYRRGIDSPWVLIFLAAFRRLNSFISSAALIWACRCLSAKSATSLLKPSLM